MRVSHPHYPDQVVQPHPDRTIHLDLRNQKLTNGHTDSRDQGFDLSSATPDGHPALLLLCVIIIRR